MLENVLHEKQPQILGIHLLSAASTSDLKALERNACLDCVCFDQRKRDTKVMFANLRQELHCDKQFVLEDMTVHMSKCASVVANGTGVKSIVSWGPDGVSLIHLIHQEQITMVTSFSKLNCFSTALSFAAVVLCVLIQHLPNEVDKTLAFESCELRQSHWNVR